MTAIFLMPANMISEFTSWMENNHHKKMLRTNHFEHIGKTIDTTDPIHSKVCYRLEIKSRANWEVFLATFLPKFNEKWDFSIQKKILTTIVIMGEEKELHLHG